MNFKLVKSVHAGEILLKEFLEPNNITAYKLAKHIRISQTQIGRILKGTRSISPDTALRLSKALNTSPEFWLGIQNKYDVENLSDEIKEEIATIKPLI